MAACQYGGQWLRLVLPQDLRVAGEVDAAQFARLLEVDDAERRTRLLAAAVIADRGADASIRLHTKLGFKEQGHLAKVGTRFGKPIGSYLLSLNLGR